MSESFMAEFDDADALLAAAKRLREDGFDVIDAFTPFPVAGLAELIEPRSSHLRSLMLIAGLVVAATAFAVQSYSAVMAYPINTGGRPLFSWPVFLLVPFEVGILAAAIAGFAGLLWGTGLPRLHHPVFEVVGFERVTQDRFFLLARDPRGKEVQPLRDAFDSSGALLISQVPS
jgi:hypothetical protein